MSKWPLLREATAKARVHSPSSSKKGSLSRRQRWNSAGQNGAAIAGARSKGKDGRAPLVLLSVYKSFKDDPEFIAAYVRPTVGDGSYR
jgi:hypothetical protein